MDNNFNNDNMQSNGNGFPPQGGERDFSSQFAQYNQPRGTSDGGNTDYNSPYQPQQPAQPDYNQYQPQQPVQPDYNQYQPQQPVQPDYNQYQPQQPVQPDYNQYQPQQPVQPDYNQYQPAQPDYNQYQPAQPDYNQYQQPDYNNQYQQPYDYNAPQGYTMPADVPTGAAKAFSIVSLICGIVSMVACCYGIIAGIPGLVFAIIAKSKFKGKNTMAQLGLIFSIVGIALSIIWFIVFMVTGIADGVSSNIRYY